MTSRRILETKYRISETAMALFLEEGYENVTVEAVAEASRTSRRTVFRHFGSKEELAVEAFGYALECAVEARTRDLEAVSGAVNRLERAVQRFVEVPSAVPGGCPLMNTAVDADDGNPALLLLAQEGVSARVVNMATIKPIDGALLVRCAKETGAIVTAEDHNIHGGLGGAVAESLATTRPCPIEFVGVRDVFGASGEPEELAVMFGIGAKSIAEAARKVIARKRTP